MLATFLTVLEQMLKIFIFMALGYAFNKLHLVPKSAEHVLSRFVILLFLPALSLYSNMMECNLNSLAAYSQWALIGAAGFFVTALIAQMLSKRFADGDPYREGIYRYAFTMPNTGSVATPLMLSMFGTKGLFLYSIFGFFLGLMCYSWGVNLLTPNHVGKQSIRSVLRGIFNINFNAKLLGMILGLLGAPNWTPDIVLDSVSSLADCLVPISLMMVGFSIADYSFRDVFTDRKVFFFMLIRQIGFPLAFLAVLYLIKAPSLLCLMAVVTYVCPCGMNVVVYPAAYGQDCKLGASMVLLTSIASILLMPLICSLVQSVFGAW